jgi:phosphoribosylglycinamide formyltransferase-1
MINIALFASGEGTNAENLINYFSASKEVKIKLVVTNNAEAGIV